jgi:hypothetical protein
MSYHFGLSLPVNEQLSREKERPPFGGLSGEVTAALWLDFSSSSYFNAPTSEPSG